MVVPRPAFPMVLVICLGVALLKLKGNPSPHRTDCVGGDHPTITRVVKEVGVWYQFHSITLVDPPWIGPFKTQGACPLLMPTDIRQA